MKAVEFAGSDRLARPTFTDSVDITAPSMFASLSTVIFVALQCTLFRGAVASPQPPVVAQLESRDIFSFYASQNQLQNAANIFANDHFSTPDGVAQLQVIANHIKACSDLFDFATIQLASLIPAGEFLPRFSPADGPTLNTTFVPSTQNTILGTLNTLLFGKAFFEAVNGSPQMRIVLCHWVGDLARENDAFLGLLVQAADVQPFTAYWAQLRTAAAAGYGEFLGNVNGFRCNGLQGLLLIWKALENC
ncbi:hypothetical protein B0H10DRAFT_2214628 [Mycena sp. CBHHK59/15]|nr:hypothetical protein B0H10DRAFT_2214628 [Mycena sp. CBHHK59/15]